MPKIYVMIQNDELINEEEAAAIEADNTQWDVLLATDEAQNLLEKLAGEALAEHRVGKTRTMAFNNAGRIVPVSCR